MVYKNISDLEKEYIEANKLFIAQSVFDDVDVSWQAKYKIIEKAKNEIRLSCPNILDACCGFGTLSFFLSEVYEHSCKITGIDLDYDKIKKAKSIKEKFYDKSILEFYVYDYYSVAVKDYNLIIQSAINISFENFLEDVEVLAGKSFHGYILLVPPMHNDYNDDGTPIKVDVEGIIEETKNKLDAIKISVENYNRATKELHAAIVKI